ncbi:MAG: Homoserine kinase [Pseudomonadota bacterium]|jgi:homoserine kinase type II
MAVFTEVSFEEAAEFVRGLHLHGQPLGELTELKGCSGGIENTNFFATTDQGRYVLTLFERLTHEQLPFYLHLMQHLASKGIPVPDPAQDKHGEILHTLKGKPAAVVNRLEGASQLQPQPAHTRAVGEMLARMHLAGRDYQRQQPNLRGLKWWNETIPLVTPHLSEAQKAMIESELAYQNHLSSTSAGKALPRGPIHADLFRDNVMFEGERLTGFFDFYFAGFGTWLFDIAVCLNDWCIDLPTGQTDMPRSQAFMVGYESVRPLQAVERELLSAKLRAGALRFWVSRLWDFHLPREASMLTPHDPTHFERVLSHRQQRTELARTMLDHAR